jgi:hypothetical protein
MNISSPTQKIRLSPQGIDVIDENPIASWVNWIISVGIVVVIEGFGAAFLARAYITFDIGVATAGIVLLLAGAVMEFFIWSKKTSLLKDRLAIVDAQRKASDERVFALEKALLASAPGPKQP